MKETTPAAMPPCFDKWCQRFDDLLRTKAQKREFRHYLGGLLGESERKNVSQMARDAVEVTYHKLHHFLTESTWSADKINERRLEVMNKCSQTRISNRKNFNILCLNMFKYQRSYLSCEPDCDDFVVSTKAQDVDL